jgi:hypothetical protein
MSVKVAEYNFPEHKRGTTFENHKIIISKNLTGCQIIMQFKSNYGSKMAYEFKTSDNSILITNPSIGEFELQKRLLDVPKGTYNYDGLIIFSDSSKKVYFEGIQVITDNYSA